MEDNAVVVFKHGDIAVTEEQRKTFVDFISAQNPTEEEIKLHFYFCAAKGVHPLDRLIYFTKRNGKYTPITSIDYLRIRAESSGLYAGSDDAVFKGELKKGAKTYPLSATVTVWKLVNGQRCPFTATARWAEYAPSDLEGAAAFMWRSKPCIMLAKCSEALALRKGFPGQLQGLYISEEYDQSATQAVNYPVNVSHVKNGGEASEAVVDNDAPVEEPVEEVAQVRMIEWFDGKQKPAETLIDGRNISAFKTKFVGPGLTFGANAHLKNHLRKHFHVDELAELTWEKFGALINHVKSGIDDARWYTEEAAPVRDRPVSDAVDRDELAKRWKNVPFAELESALQVRAVDMLALVDVGAIATDDYDAMIEVLNA